MGARTLVTFEQFEQFPDDGMKHELVKGEHIVVPPPKSRHTRIQQKIQDVLRPFVREHRLGEVHRGGVSVDLGHLGATGRQFPEIGADSIQ